MQSRELALKHATKIRKVSPLSVPFNPLTVFICPDMTKLQRDADIELRKKLTEKRQDDPNWVIQSGRIVRRERIPPSDPGGTEGTVGQD